LVWRLVPPETEAVTLDGGSNVTLIRLSAIERPALDLAPAWLDGWVQLARARASLMV
jgi:hypothetical protein